MSSSDVSQNFSEVDYPSRISGHVNTKSKFQFDKLNNIISR